MTDEDPMARARALLAEADGASRGTLKRLAGHLDGDAELRAALVAVGRARGADLPPGAEAWPAKRLLRVCRAREATSRTRRNPVARDEGFTCASCGAEVPPHGRTARDHCPHCLRSLHVDVVPGDRAEECGGILDPIAVETVGGETRIHYRCRRCGAERVNRAVLDGEVPDDWAALSAVAAGEVP